MRKVFVASLILAVQCLAGMPVCYGLDDLQKSIDDYRTQSQLRQAEMDAEMARIQAQTERMRANSERNRADTERMRSETNSLQAFIDAENAKKAQEKAKQAMAEQAEATKQAMAEQAEAANDLRVEMERSAIKSKNNTYLIVSMLLFAGFVIHPIRKVMKGQEMQNYQKYGVSVVIASLLLLLLVMSLSENWDPQTDLLSNLMLSLELKFFQQCDTCSTYYIVIHTKYAVLACLGVMAYGFTTYLGITPALGIKSKSSNANPTPQ